MGCKHQFGMYIQKQWLVIFLTLSVILKYHRLKGFVWQKLFPFKGNSTLHHLLMLWGCVLRSPVSDACVKITPILLVDGSPMTSRGTPVRIKGHLHYMPSALLSSGSRLFVCCERQLCVCLKNGEKADCSI